jgi:hypothetical protein
MNKLYNMIEVWYRGSIEVNGVVPKQHYYTGRLWFLQDACIMVH